MVIQRDRFADALAVAMADAALTRAEAESIVRAWLPLGHPVGTPLHVSGTGTRRGLRRPAPDGALRLRRLRRWGGRAAAGDVELRHL